MAVYVGLHYTRTPRSDISTIQKLPKTVIISHDVRGAHVRPTALDGGSGMSGKSLRGRGLGVLDVCLEPRQLQVSCRCLKWIRKVRSF